MNKYIYTRLLLRTLYVHRSNLKSRQYSEGTKKERKRKRMEWANETVANFPVKWISIEAMGSEVNEKRGICSRVTGASPKILSSRLGTRLYLRNTRYVAIFTPSRPWKAAERTASCKYLRRASANWWCIRLHAPTEADPLLSSLDRPLTQLNGVKGEK